MLEFISKQISYNYSLKKHLLIGISLGGIITFVMIFLQPFGTYNFESNHKYLIFLGFGLLIFGVYIFWARIENIWYDYKNKKWEIKYEIVSFILFMLIASLPIHFYNQVFLNDLFDSKYDGYEYLKHGFWFFQHSMIPIMVILSPFYVYLRNKLGVLNTPDSSNKVKIYGINKNEKITIMKEALLFVKASENYVNIYYTENDLVRHKTFRNTLAAINIQAPFLQKAHRSYLVNISTIKRVNGNSQNGKIEFHINGLEIPLSKSYYKTIKSALAIQPID